MAKSEPRNRRKKKQGSGNEDIISMTNVTKSYATGAPALNGIDLHIKPGEFVFIVGDSGSGKSTMIKLLLRELVPTSGEISVMGYDLLKIRHRKIPKFRRNLGIVFQDFRLLKDRNVYENVAFAQRVVNRPTRVIRKRVPEVLQEVGLAGKYKAYPDELSGGEQQRVILARALAQQTPALILDEPTNHLDITHQIMLMELVKKLNVTVISAIHDLNIAAAYCDKIYVLKDGVLEGYGTPQEVLTPELIKRIYQVDSEVVNDSRGKMRILFL